MTPKYAITVKYVNQFFVINLQLIEFVKISNKNSKIPK